VGLHILTGAPGTGKTAVLAELSSSFAIVQEPARQVLAVERAAGSPVSLLADADRFVALLRRRSIESYERTMTFDLVLAFHEALDRAYCDANYEVVEVPRASVTERAAFVRGVIGP